jgi:hypothetical protein
MRGLDWLGGLLLPASLLRSRPGVCLCIEYGRRRDQMNDPRFVQSLYDGLKETTRCAVEKTVEAVLEARRAGGSIMVVTGSGPNIHEGVTTLISELIRRNIIHGVSTSSAVVAHEMAGSLEKVRRVKGADLGLNSALLARAETFEINILDDDDFETLRSDMALDMDLIRRAKELPGEEIIKAAGNMAYPMGLRTERVALEVESLARAHGLPFEKVAGFGADPMTMIGAGSEAGVPVIVSVPQLVGGGMVGLAIGDSISLRRRCSLMAQMLSNASVIIESGVALTQEIHDGPFETYTGHGIWSAWDGMHTFSLQGKTLVRIDLDKNLEKVWRLERSGGRVQQAINKGLPKTKAFKVPFRMEMSGFARLETSIPIVGDLGTIWPVLAWRVAKELGIKLNFVSYPQDSARGMEMREWIVKNVRCLDRHKMRERVGREW